MLTKICLNSNQIKKRKLLIRRRILLISSRFKKRRKLKFFRKRVITIKNTIIARDLFIVMQNASKIDKIFLYIKNNDEKK